MKTIRLVLPPIALSPNGRHHWAKRAEATRWYRDFACNSLKASGKPMNAKHVRLHVQYDISKSLDPGYRPRDIMNGMSALKAAIDGLVDAGMVKDDSWKYVSWGSLTITKTGNSGVTIVIEPINQP